MNVFRIEIKCQNVHVVMCFSTFRGIMKYYVVSFCGEQVPIKQYDITPFSWILSKEKTWFPLYERTKLEKLVEGVKQPTPKKDFAQYDIKILHSTGLF